MLTVDVEWWPICGGKYTEEGGGGGPNCGILSTASQTTDLISYRTVMMMMMLIEAPFIRTADPIPSRLITHLGPDISQSHASTAKCPANQPMFSSCQND